MITVCLEGIAYRSPERKMGETHFFDRLEAGVPKPRYGSCLNVTPEGLLWIISLAYLLMPGRDDAEDGCP